MVDAQKEQDYLDDKLVSLEWSGNQLSSLANAQPQAKSAEVEARTEKDSQPSADRKLKWVDNQWGCLKAEAWVSNKGMSESVV